MVDVENFTSQLSNIEKQMSNPSSEPERRERKQQRERRQLERRQARIGRGGEFFSQEHLSYPSGKGNFLFEIFTFIKLCFKLWVAHRFLLVGVTHLFSFCHASHLRGKAFKVYSGIFMHLKLEINILLLLLH